MFSSKLEVTVFAVLCTVLLQAIGSFAAPNTLSSAPPDGRIINGTAAEMRATMHQVSVRRRLNDGYFFGTGHICGGSLIAPTVVLSAAHCFIDMANETSPYITALDFIVVMGNLDRFVQNNNTLTYDITHILYGIDHFNISTYYRDIALLFLAGTVPANHPTVQPILINRRTPMVGGTICQVTGWGNTEEGYLSDILMSVDVPIITNDVCSSDTLFSPTAIRDGMMCAGYMEGERDACGGDSGGPLVCNGLLTGIVSWGSGCAQPLLPGVYTDVAFFAPWLDEQVEAAGGYLPGDAASSMRASHMLLLALVTFGLFLHKFY